MYMYPSLLVEATVCVVGVDEAFLNTAVLNWQNISAKNQISHDGPTPTVIVDSYAGSYCSYIYKPLRAVV